MPRNYRRGRGLQRARAPYNFVPLITEEPNDSGSMQVYEPMPAQNGLPAHNVFDENLKSGYFTVHVKAKTPLFIRGMLNREQSKHNEKQRKANKETTQSEDFFSHDGETPVIPGSSLKGMIRSLVEIISFGKMHFVSDSPKIFFRAVAPNNRDPNPHDDPYQQVLGRFSRNVRAGYLKKKGERWYILPAQKIFGQHIEKVKDIKRNQHTRQIEQVFITQVDNLKHFIDDDYEMKTYEVICYKQGEGLRVRSAEHGESPNAIMICTGNMAETGDNADSPRSSYHVIGLPLTNADLVEIPEHVIQDYLDGLTPFQKGGAKQSENYLNKKFGVLEVNKPVFYIKNNEDIITHFGHTRNFRIPHLFHDPSIDHEYKYRGITPRDLVPQKLLDTHFVDYADAMFGYVSDSNEEQRNPKAYAGRVSVTSALPINDNYAIHNHAVTPRILGSPKPTTFQHYLEQPPQAANDKSRLHHFGTRQAVIRGTKQYWRQDIKGVSDIEANPDDIKDKEKVTTQIKPLTEGEFTFTVHFTNLTHTELGALAWALTLGDDPNAYHMLGMGKPHGMGVVKLAPQLTIINRSTRYSQLFSASGEWFTGEESGNTDTYIQAFKDAVHNHTHIAFDDHWRIQQLKAMLRLQPKQQELAYMELEQFKDRPVLPYPVEIDNSRGSS